MILVAVAVRAVDHDRLAQSLLGQALAQLADAGVVVVRAGPAAAAEDHVAALVAGGLEDRGHALLGDRREPVPGAGRQHGVDGGLGAAVGAVLEADRHRQAGRQLAVHLALGGAGADRHPRREVGDVLRDLGVEELRSGREPHVVDVEQQLSGEAQPLVDVEALVEVGIVDEALPANRRPRLLEVAPHHEDQVVGVACRQLLEAVGVLQAGLLVVDRAGSGDDDQPGIAALDGVGDGGPGVGDHVRGALADRDFLQQDGRGNQRADVGDTQVVGAAEHHPSGYPGERSGRRRTRMCTP